MIELQGVTKRYDSLIAVDNMSLTLQHGEYMALLGPNGAGKTTIVKLLLDFTRPDKGSLAINGIASTDPLCRSSLGFLAENHRIPAHLTGWQYLQRCARLLGIGENDASEQCHTVVELVGMQGRERAKAYTYSKGMTQRFGIAAALLGKPKLLILDEPTGGLDPIGIREIRQLLESLRPQGITMLLNSHLLSEVEKICDTAAIINRGRLLVKQPLASLVGERESLEDVFVRLVTGEHA